MNYLKELITGLPGDILANLIATATTTILAFIISVRGKNPGAEANIHADQSNGQRIFAPNNSGIIDSSQHHTTTHKNTVIKNYGSQSTSSRSGDDTPWLYGILAVMGVGVVLWASRLLPFITPLPLYIGGAVALIAVITLIARRASFTTVALRKTALAITGLIGASILTTFTMVQAQNLANPYSLLSIADRAQNMTGSDKVLSGAPARAFQLMSPGNQEYMYAFLLGTLTIIFSWLTLLYYLRITLGSLLFPASSNGQQFTGLLASLNTSFVKSSWLGMVNMAALAYLMFWIVSPEGTTHIFSWATVAFTWLQEFIKTL